MTNDQFDPFGDANTGPSLHPTGEHLEQEAPGDFDPFGDGGARTGQGPTFGGEAANRQPYGVAPLGQSAAEHQAEVYSDAARRSGLHRLGDAWSASTATAHATQQPARTPSILFVCTGNVCRSPYGDRYLAHRLEGLPIEVSSAGTSGLVGHEIEPGSVKLLERVGARTDGFSARRLSPEIAESASLILTAEREHRRLVVHMAPQVLTRTFAIRDFAEFVRPIGAKELSEVDGVSGIDRLVKAAALQRPYVRLGDDDEANIIDPFRRDDSVFEQMEQQMTGALDIIAEKVRLAEGS